MSSKRVMRVERVRPNRSSAANRSSVHRVPANRSSVPAIARRDPADESSKPVGTKGATKRGGRQKGTRNRITTALKEAIILAASTVGRDGRGQDGLHGYLVKLAKTEPKVYATLLRAVIPLHIVGQVDHDHRVYQTREEVVSALREKGLPVDMVYSKDLDAWTPDKDDRGH